MVVHQICCFYALSAEWFLFIDEVVFFVIAEDIQIRFFEQSPEGDVIWEAFPDVNDLDVHHQVTKLGVNF